MPQRVAQRLHTARAPSEPGEYIRRMETLPGFVPSNVLQGPSSGSRYTPAISALARSPNRRRALALATADDESLKRKGGAHGEAPIRSSDIRGDPLRRYADKELKMRAGESLRSDPRTALALALLAHMVYI